MKNNGSLSPNSLDFSAYSLSELLTDGHSNQSHIIRKPVANIMGLCCLLDDMNLEPETRNIFNMLFQSASELDHLITGVKSEN